MKKLILALFLLPTLAYSQKMSCCKASSTESFAQLSNDENFVASHLSPLPINYVSEKGELIAYRCGTGNKANAFLIKPEKPSNKWLFIFHEWWGLNDYIKREADNYSNDFPEVNILALDLYDGQNADDPGKAKELMSNMTDTRAREIINGAIEYAGANAKIATIGWCMGGGWSLQTSLMAGSKAIGCVMYYGMPETDISKLKKLNADVFGVFAIKDEWITKTLVEKFQEDMKTAGKKINVKYYEANHAFANPSNPDYQKEAAEDARMYVVKFLGGKFH